MSLTAFGIMLNSDNIVSAENNNDDNYELNNMGVKYKSHGMLRIKWNTNNVVNGLKNIGILENDFEYSHRTIIN